MRLLFAMLALLALGCGIHNMMAVPPQPKPMPQAQHYHQRHGTRFAYQGRDAWYYKGWGHRTHFQRVEKRFGTWWGWEPRLAGWYYWNVELNAWLPSGYWATALPQCVDKKCLCSPCICDQCSCNK